VRRKLALRGRGALAVAGKGEGREKKRDSFDPKRRGGGEKKRA